MTEEFKHFFPISFFSTGGHGKTAVKTEISGSILGTVESNCCAPPLQLICLFLALEVVMGKVTLPSFPLQTSRLSTETSAK